MATIAEFLSATAPSLVFDKGLAVNAFFFIVLLAITSGLIFKFATSISKRNLLYLNLNQYNTSEHPLFKKVIATGFFLLEYILFIPFLIWLWFAGLAVVLLLLQKDGQGVTYILLITTALIGAIRVLAYIKRDIAIDLAKLFPFITLSAVLLAPGDVSLYTILSRFEDIPSLIKHIFSYVLVIFFLEIFLRIFYTIYKLWVHEDIGKQGRLATTHGD